MKRILLYLCLGITTGILFQPLHGQVSGYLGKKFIVKSDLTSTFLEDGYSVEVEGALFRDRSISLEYSQRGRTVIKPYYEIWDLVSDSDTSIFESTAITLKVRSYLNKAIPAPKGAYSFLFLRYGKAKIDRSRVVEGDPGFGVDRIITYETYKLRNAHFYQGGIGWGYQTIIADRLVLDGAWSVVLSNTSAGIEFQETIADRTQDFGHNLLNITRGSVRGPNVGISGYLAVGVFLF